MRITTKVAKMGILLLLFFAAAALAVAALVEENEGRSIKALQKESYISEAEASYIRPGLNITIVDITIPADRKPVVTVKYTDNLGQPLDRLGVLTPGAISSSFILAYLPASQAGEVTDYVAYTTRSVTTPANSPNPGVKTIQAGADSGGTWTEVGGGVYTYKFGTTLPANYNTALTHTLGIYGRRDLREWGLSFYVSNPTKNWVPNGSSVTQIHDIATTAACNQCHDPLALHGETGRREMPICVLCHTPQTIDPDTGNTVDMKVMTHKIHMGDSLPSGEPYIIYGNQQSVHDYSHVVFPQDIRNCDTCHAGSKQTNAWKLFPSIEACGSCHDNVDFATGANHAAGPATNSQCAWCHQPEGQYEYDASVAGAHTVPYKSKQLEYPKLTVISLTNTAPGQSPTVQFKITDKNGNAMDPARFGGTLGRFSANLAGPTTDYTTRITETISGATSVGGGAYSYTFKTIKIPATAKESWALQFEGRLTATIVRGGDPEDTFTQRDAMDNVVKYFSVDGSTVVPRRTVVSLASCNNCHEKLQLHGSNRNTIESCVVCHNPTLTAGSNPAGTSDSFSMQYMVHKIHTGEELENGYWHGTGTDYGEVLYPGDRRNCGACHVGTTYTVPLPLTNVAIATPKNFWSPTMPIAAACISCHDGVATAAHAFINTAVFGSTQVESCAVCHKESAAHGVSEVHAR